MPATALLPTGAMIAARCPAEPDAQPSSSSNSGEGGLEPLKAVGTGGGGAGDPPATAVVPYMGGRCSATEEPREGPIFLLDACAAPGNKTMHMAALLHAYRCALPDAAAEERGAAGAREDGTDRIWAFER